jgi:hypothetical protein
MFEQLGQAIEGLDIPVDGEALAAVLALRDRLDARISCGRGPRPRRLVGI